MGNRTKLSIRTSAVALTALVCVTGSSRVQASPLLYIDDNANNIGTVDLATGTVTVLGNANSPAPGLGDIGFDSSGKLYGIDVNSEFYSLNKTTGQATQISTLSPALAYNSLVGNPGGTLYAAARNSNELFSINPTTGVGTDLGTVGFGAAGDLALVNGVLYEAAVDPTGGANNILVRIPLGGVYTGTNVGSFGVSNVYGLAADNSGKLYAVSGTEIYSVNLSTAALTPLLDYSGHGLIAAAGEAFVAEASVPEPTASAAVALAGVGLLRRRRRGTAR